MKVLGFDILDMVVNHATRPVDIDEIRLVGERLSRQSVTFSDEPIPAMSIVDAYKHAKSLLEKHATYPQLVAVWFVDKRDLHNQFVSAMRRETRNGETPLFDIASVRIILHLKQYRLPGERVAKREEGMDRLDGGEGVVYPWWCDHPGIWAEFRGGVVSPVIFNDPKITT